MKVSKIFVLFNVILVTHYLVFGMSKRASKNAISFKKFREDLSKKIAKNKKAILITLGSLIGAVAVSAGVGYGIYKHKKKNKYGKPGYYRSSVPYTSSISSSISQAKKAPASVPVKSTPVPTKAAPAPAKSAPAPAKAAPAPAKGTPAPAKGAPAPARGAPAPAKGAPAPAKGTPAPAKGTPAPARGAPAPARGAPAPAKPAPAPAKPAVAPASSSRPSASPTTYPPAPVSPALSKSTTPPPRSSPPTVGGGSSAYNNPGMTRPGTTSNLYGTFKY
ncbi:early transcribed membrane protein [Plasmodium vinckei lentum]|uniref:Early transcribed membrane protein n=1 Tax=Plasmodium vinckei lentum TaxID=138297 RepID=A0A6V7RZI7_PLAVN|nr:early transcribed membrane protein [Plasmodium vinckei lentum]